MSTDNREREVTNAQPEQVEATEQKPVVKGKRLKTGVRGGGFPISSHGGLSTWSCAC